MLALFGPGAVGPAAAETDSAATPPAAWAARGDRVAARYAAYEKRLAALYATLRERASRDAPDAFASVSAERPPALPQGYGILPRIVADVPAPARRERGRPSVYSWPWTESLMEREIPELARFETDLDRAATLTPAERTAAYAKLVASWRRLAERQRMIDAHVMYNRQWQAAIAGDRPLYDRLTVLVHAALERESIRSTLAGMQPSQAGSGVESELRRRDVDLSRVIHEATDRTNMPAFVRVEHAAAHRWVVWVPVYTDIGDPAFLRAFRSAVEDVWRLRDGVDDFRVKVAITEVAPARLYAPAAPPARGGAIDLHAHVARFPKNGSVLTTGASLTHVIEGPSIVLGPHDLARHVLAHEFGHVLGFRDVYFRGYRDLGADGYEVTEVIADPDDIMGAPGAGPVLRHHFETLLREDASRRVR